MEQINTGKIGDCSRCGKPATHYFSKKKFNWRIERFFCKKCWLEVLDEQGFEKTKA